MKNLKLLIAFLAGVGLTLLLTGHKLPTFNFPHPGRLLDDEGIGIVGVIVIVLLAAYISQNFAAPAEGQGAAQNKTASFFEFLRNFRRSNTDCWLGGVCGGLGKITPIPSWVWRVGFAITFLYYGSGLLAYFLLCVFIPEEDLVTEPATETASTKHGAFFDFLHKLKRSSTDCWVGGVCGGLAEKTAAPSWVWRLVFTALVLFAGVGLAAYLLLWIFLPSDETKNHLAA